MSQGAPLRSGPQVHLLLADNMFAVMEEGRVVEAGAPEELLADPAAAPRFTALHADNAGQWSL